MGRLPAGSALHAAESFLEGFAPVYGLSPLDLANISSEERPSLLSDHRKVIATRTVAGSLPLLPGDPCRAVDTRSGLGGFMGLLPNGVVNTFTIRGASPCVISASATEVAFNMTIADPTNRWVSLYPIGAVWPGVSTINFIAGENLAPHPSETWRKGC